MPSILVDGNNLGIASHYANDTLLDGDGRPSGAIFGFIRSIRPILARVQAEHGVGRVRVNVAWDSGTSWRKKLLPSYKASRKRDDPDESMQAYFDQTPRLKDLLSLLGVGQLYAEGYEADDIAGHLADVHKPITFVTNDRDWFQLVGDSCHVWAPMKEDPVTKDKGLYISPANFSAYAEGAADVEEFVRMKAIMGDKGDDIPGAAGVGPAKALAYLRGELPQWTKAKKPEPNKAFAAIEAWMSDPDGYDRSLKLVDLRGMRIEPYCWRLNPGQLNQAAVYDQFVRLGFASLLSNLPEWLKPFRLSCGAT